jgi:hypothetical protein
VGTDVQIADDARSIDHSLRLISQPEHHLIILRLAYILPV